MHQFCNCLFSPRSSLLGHKHILVSPSYKTLSSDPTSFFSYHPISILSTIKLCCLCWPSTSFLYIPFPHTPTRLLAPPLPLRLLLLRSPVIFMSPDPMRTSGLVPLSAALDTADHSLLEKIFLNFYSITISHILSHFAECFSYSSFLATFLTYPTLNTNGMPQGFVQGSIFYLYSLPGLPQPVLWLLTLSIKSTAPKFISLGQSFLRTLFLYIQLRGCSCAWLPNGYLKPSMTQVEPLIKQNSSCFTLLLLFSGKVFT